MTIAKSRPRPQVDAAGDLLRLCAEIDAVRAEYEQHTLATTKRQAVYEASKPALPAVLRFVPDDATISSALPLGFHCEQKREKFFRPDIVAKLPNAMPSITETFKVGEMPNFAVVSREIIPEPATATYYRERVCALKTAAAFYLSACEAAATRAGHFLADDDPEIERLVERHDKLIDALAETPARTLATLKAKAKALAGLEPDFAIIPDDTGRDALISSLAKDIEALTD